MGKTFKIASRVYSECSIDVGYYCYYYSSGLPGWSEGGKVFHLDLARWLWGA